MRRTQAARSRQEAGRPSDGPVPRLARPRRAREALMVYMAEELALAREEQAAGMPPRGLIGNMVVARDELGQGCVLAAAPCMQASHITPRDAC